jgi:methyl-accepting chemotaxis protein
MQSCRTEIYGVSTKKLKLPGGYVMAVSRGKSISQRLIVTLLLVLVIGQGIGAYLFLKATNSGLMNALHGRMKREIKQASALLAEPVATFNTSLIELFVTDTLNDLDIQSIRIEDASGAPVAEKTLKRDSGAVYSLSEPLSFVGSNVGKVKIVYTPKTIHDSMQNSRLLILFYQAGMLLVVALVLVRLFNRYIRVPVELLNSSIARITQGDLSETVSACRDDEIGSIANGVRFLAERLEGTVARINSNSEKVTLAVQQLNATFDTVRGGINSQNRSTEEVVLKVESAAGAQLEIAANTGQLLSLSEDNLSALLEMKASSEEIATNADHLNKNLRDSLSTLTNLAGSAQEVTSMAEEVATFVEEASTSIEQVYRSVGNVESIVNESARLSSQTTAVISGKGMQSISAATEGMQRIGTFIDSLMKAIARLDTRSRDIDKILAVIEDVTVKSRLLSLNAQIIAAQAGEKGKSFAVVAGEMKQLSDQSSASTKEIDTIISDILREIAEVVNETRESVAVVRDGEAVVQRTAGVLEEILETSRQATDLAKEIERASREQTSGLQLTVKSTEQIRSKIVEVTRATGEQEKSTSFLLTALTPLKEAMEMTKRATEEQALSTRLISGNIELANQKNSQIAATAGGQLTINQQVIEALQGVTAMGHSTVLEINGLIPCVTAMREDIEALQLEMAGFTTSATTIATTEMFATVELPEELGIELSPAPLPLIDPEPEKILAEVASSFNPENS